MMDGLCLPYCALGYKVDQKTCKRLTEFIVNYDFNTLNGIIYDKANNVPAVTGSTQNFYKNYDPDDPFPAPLRGLYFDGVTSLLRLPEYSTFKTPKIIIGPVFTFSMWINPDSSFGTLFSAYNSAGNSELLVKLLNGYPTIVIRFEILGSYVYPCDYAVSLFE